MFKVSDEYGLYQEESVWICLLENSREFPVVKCRDCIYMRDSYINSKGFRICPASGMEIADDDYCSYAESEEESCLSDLPIKYGYIEEFVYFNGLTPDIDIRCSSCNCSLYDSYQKFCQNCGALLLNHKEG